MFITLHNSDTSWYKQANNFFHPTVSFQSDAYGIADEHQFQVQIGSKPIPEYPVNSLSESLSQLRKTVGHPFQMFGRWYRTTKYIIGLDLEMVSGMGFSGISKTNGDSMTLNFRDGDFVGDLGSIPSRVFCALHYDAVSNIKDSGVELMD